MAVAFPAGSGSSSAKREQEITRRRLLIGGGATAAVVLAGAGVATGALPGRSRVTELLGMEGPDGHIPDVAPGPVAVGAFASTRRKQDTGWAVSYPPGANVGDPLPVLISLHGKGGTAQTSFEELGLDRFLADATNKGAAPFAIAAVDGGNTYWHGRKDGTDSGAMVIRELLPRLADQGLDTERLGLFGWSMGGFGALHLAAQPDMPRLRSVSTLSAALWTDFDDAAGGAFDDADDFAANDVFDQRPALTGVSVRMDCGRHDPFDDANHSYRDGLAAKPAGGFQPGLHSVGYWRRMLPDHITFASKQLTSSS